MRLTRAARRLARRLIDEGREDPTMRGSVPCAICGLETCAPTVLEEALIANEIRAGADEGSAIERVRGALLRPRSMARAEPDDLPV